MNDGLKSELLRVAAQSPDGILRPQAVVEFAIANPESELHKRFEWDDAEAATEYRVMQARQLIRLYVKFEPRVNRTVRGFVSLATDRTNDGGYRSVENVLDNPLYRGQLVEQALNDLDAVGKRYPHLPELDAVFADVSLAIAKFKGISKSSAA